MGTVPHHQAKALAFLWRADQAVAERDNAEAAAALRRAASHVATALAVHYDCKHNTRRRLEFALHVAIGDQHLSRSHLKTLRQTYSLSQRLATQPARPNPAAPTPRPEPVAGRRAAGWSRPASGGSPSSRPSSPSSRPSSPSFLRKQESTAAGHAASDHPAHPCKNDLRRLRRRVASMLTAVSAFLKGEPKPVRYHKLWLRKANFPVLPTLNHVRDIMTLPNYDEILSRFNLIGAPMAEEPDPHGSYHRGQPPRRCSCHRDLWNKYASGNANRFTLSPLWRHALEKTFRTKLPEQLQLAC